MLCDDRGFFASLTLIRIVRFSQDVMYAADVKIGVEMVVSLPEFGLVDHARLPVEGRKFICLSSVQYVVDFVLEDYWLEVVLGLH